LLVIRYNGDPTLLLNLYAVGVFMSFTLSQGGMVRHWWRLRREQKGWLRSMILNGLGAVNTFLVVLMIAISKFLVGAWIVIVLIPLLVLMFIAISRHYKRFEREKVSDIPIRPQDIHHRVIVPIAGLDRAAIQSLAYARSISKHVTAVHVAIDVEDANKVREVWERWQSHLTEDDETQLIIIESPYRSLSRPLLAYIDTVHELFPTDTLTVILAEFVVAHWWEQLLHNQTALRLKASLLFRPGIVVTSVPQHLRSRRIR
ncbi:MAG TPA: amino acid permease, partial [Ktedonobacteraceae bacterium]